MRLPWMLIWLGLTVPTAGRAAPSFDPAKKAAAIEHLKAGLKYYDDGEYPKAIIEYEAAYKLYPSPKLFPNIGSCYKYMGRNLEALEYYERFVKATDASVDAPGIKKLRREVAVEIRNLLRLVGRLRVVVTVPGAVVKVAGLERGRAPFDQELRFEPGRINITVKKKGHYNFDRTVRINAGKGTTVEVRVLIKIKPKVVVRFKQATPLYKRWWFWTAVGSLVAGGVTALAVTYGTRTEEKTLSGDLKLNHNSLSVRW